MTEGSWPTSPANRGRPLEGVKVLDVSRVLAGPFCTMLLADLGADVVKVEPPSGDETRRWGATALDGSAAYYFATNRNKWDVVLDLGTTAGLDALRGLVTEADVLVHNYTGALARKLRVDYETVKAINPTIVYLSVSGFGPEEPERRGYDLIAQALGGIMAITGPSDGSPTKVGIALSDITAGLFSALGVVAALFGRTKDAKGKRLDVSLYDSTLSLLTNQAMSWLISGIEGRRLGNDHPTVCPYGVYATGDGSIVLAAGTDGQFRALCDAMGLGELPNDERFAKNVDRVRHRDELRVVLESVLAAHSAKVWLELLKKTGVPTALVRSVPEALSAPEARSVSEITHPHYGPVRQVRNPIRVDGSYLDPYLAPPQLDEHHDVIFRDSSTH